MSLINFHYGENNINTGPLKEIPEICIDHFHGNDLNSCVFFLSHAHTDHLVGLETNEFVRRLRQPGVKLYCHPLTPIFLGSFERYLGGPAGIKRLIAEKKIVPLDVDKPLIITIPRIVSALEVKVTLLPAGHCPGSVMFLFETSKFRTLHTGDFRLSLEDLKRMPRLHENGLPKSINHLYVDTTFCSLNASLFPNRKQVLQEALQHIKDWVSISKQHVINISFSAKFAHEYVLLELYKTFQQRIHVVPARRNIYANIPEIYDITTLDTDTQFHLCGDRNCVENGSVLTLRFSSIWYTRRSNRTDRESIMRAGNFLTICYSMHASLDEIAEVINYLKPQIVTPLVLPVNSELKEIENSLRLATSTSFKFEDYYSSRNDFENIKTPAAACTLERDPTDMPEVEEDLNRDDEDDAIQSYENVNLSPDQSVKRLKLSEGCGPKWQFCFSPSPKSKYSQSSESSCCVSEGSQEIGSQSLDNSLTHSRLVLSHFARPSFKRKLSLNENNLHASSPQAGCSSKVSFTSFINNENGEGLNISDTEEACRNHDNDSDITLDSQRFL